MAHAIDFVSLQAAGAELSELSLVRADLLSPLELAQHVWEPEHSPCVTDTSGSHTAWSQQGWTAPALPALHGETPTCLPRPGVPLGNLHRSSSGWQGSCRVPYGHWAGAPRTPLSASPWPLLSSTLGEAQEMFYE